MIEPRVILITGSSRGVGRFLAEYYIEKGRQVIGCSRKPSDFENTRYHHFTLDVSDEQAVTDMFFQIDKEYSSLDVLINNAGVASMIPVLLTPLKTMRDIYSTNVFGLFLFCREAAKIMKRNRFGRIINFSSVALPYKLEGEAVYASSKASVVSLTQILAREFGNYNITVNAVGPAPVDTDLIKSLPKDKIERLVQRQAIKRKGTFQDIANVVDFFIKPESDFISGQVLYLGGV
ncbi:MAG: SDR family oxidoreductase [Candidatus Aminicenantes bacterium]